MAEGILLTTDEEIDTALKAAMHEDPGPMAASAQFLRETRLLLICLNSGQRMAFPVEDLEDVQDATDEDLSEVEIHGPGTVIHFTKFGHGVYVPALVEGIYGSDQWMQKLAAKRTSVLMPAA